jgi:hypothetical protein
VIVIPMATAATVATAREINTRILMALLLQRGGPGVHCGRRGRLFTAC